MERQACPLESKIVAALQLGALPAELAKHTLGCPECADTLLVASCLGNPGEVEVPAAGLVYWKAEIRLRREQAERAMAPMRIMERAAVGTLVAIALIGGAWSGSPWIPAAVAGCGVMVAGSGLAIRRLIGGR